MVVNLSGIIFNQIYGDNSGGPEFDSDLDGTATQEDEFVSLTNTTGAPIDVSGWQIWSDSTGGGAPDSPQDGLYHTFPDGTIIAPGDTLYIINEITGTPPGWAQEASVGGMESGGGGTSTNFLSEGNSPSNSSEAIFLVNTDDEYIVFNMAGENRVNPPDGFPGETLVGTVDGESVQADMGAGFSYQYDEATDQYVYDAAFVPCFAAGTLMDTPQGPRPVETLCAGDLVMTLDHGPRPVAAVLLREMRFDDQRAASHKPVEFKPGSLGQGRPARTLVVSPQHRMLVHTVEGQDVLVPAKAMIDMAGVRSKHGCRKVTYVHILFDRHEIVCAQGALSESFYPGSYAMSACDAATQAEILRIFPETALGGLPAPIRTLMPVGEARRMIRKGKMGHAPGAQGRL